MSEKPKQNKGEGLSIANLLKRPSNFIVGHPEAALLFWFFGGCRFGLLLFSVLFARYNNWLVGCFGLNGPLRQYFSVYGAVSQRERERKEKR